MTNNDELYHYGIPGMRWGQKRAKLKAKKEKALVKSTDERVEQYGKGTTKFANRVGMAGIAYATYKCGKVVGKIGGKKVRNLGTTTKSKLVATATLATMGGMSVAAVKGINRLHKSNKIANQYKKVYVKEPEN